MVAVVLTVQCAPPWRSSRWVEVRCGVVSSCGCGVVWCEGSCGGGGVV